MTLTLHNVSIHGSIVVENALVPIGLFFSEEAAQGFSLIKFSRVVCNRDILNRLILISDLFIIS